MNLESLTEEERIRFEERAGILEFDAKISRNEAEAQAIQEILSSRTFIKKSSGLINLGEFLSQNIKPVEWIVPELLPEGLTILASRPKLGKSWLCLNLSLSIASGTKVFKRFDVEPQKVLYVTFEDSEARLSDRIQSLISTNHFKSKTLKENFILTPELTIPFLDEGGLSFLTEKTNEEGIKLIIIDTFPRAISKNQSGRQASYLSDYKMISPYQNFALENHISLYFVYHTRKAISDDEYVIDEIQGTTGITAGADTLMVLKKEKENFKLYVTGKDVISDDLNLEFDNTSGLWLSNSNDIELNTTPEREQIIELLKREGREMRTSEIASKLGKRNNNVSTMLQKLVKEAKLKSPKYGFYTLPD